MILSKGLHSRLKLAGFLLLGVALPITAYAADTQEVSAKLKADYVLSRVGTIGLKFDYNRVLQPGTVLSVRIPGIFADLANTPQAIVNTVITDGVAQQQRGVLSALSNTSQGKMLQPGDPVYVLKLDVKQDSVHMELLTGGNMLPRYRAEVKFNVPGLSSMQPVQVEQIIAAGLSSEPVAARAGEGTIASPAATNYPIRVSRPGVAPISPEQQAHISTLLERVPASVAKQVSQATETIKPFIALESCITDYSGKSQLQTYLGPHGDLNAVNPPFLGMHYHDKGICLDLARFQGWTPLSLNAVQFQVVYTAADSGESAVRTHVMQQEPDGTWLMND